MRQFTSKTFTWAKATAIVVYYRSIYTAGILLTIYLATILFIKFVPGEFFLRYEPALVTDAVEGQSVPVTLCRYRTFIGEIETQNIRTFYKRVDDTYRTVGSYRYNLSVESGNTCVAIDIPPQQFSHQSGYYKFRTDVTFFINDERKTIGYDSNVYRIERRPTNAELELDLRQQIDDLQRQLDAIKRRTGVMTGQEQPIAQPQASSSPPAQRQQSTTSAPPYPEVTSRVTPSSEFSINRMINEGLQAIGQLVTGMPPQW